MSGSTINLQPRRQGSAGSEGIMAPGYPDRGGTVGAGGGGPGGGIGARTPPMMERQGSTGTTTATAGLSYQEDGERGSAGMDAKRRAGGKGSPRPHHAASQRQMQTSSSSLEESAPTGSEAEIGRKFCINPPQVTNPTANANKYRNQNNEPLVVGEPWMRKGIMSCLMAPYLAHLAMKERRKRQSDRPFVDNTIRTARYTVYDFIPKQLFLQFSKTANAYFLFIVILQLIPDLSPTGQYTTIFPLSVVVIVSIARECYDDWKRHKHDSKENNSPVRRLVRRAGGRGNLYATAKRRSSAAMEMSSYDPSSGLTCSWEDVTWHDLQVGDVVSVKDKEFIPADLIVLQTSSPNGVCYIETSNLDGETNLKQRQALKATSDAIVDVEALGRFSAIAYTEPPSGDLYAFDGYLVEGRSRYPLSVNQLLQRGATLRNTKEIFGAVVYTGEESKIRKNSNSDVKTKVPSLERQTNRIIVATFLILILLSTLLFLAFLNWDLNENAQGRRHWYLKSLLYGPKQYVIAFFSNIVLFNAFIPISLYVTMEIIKLYQVYFMNNDLAMFDEEREIPCEANTSTLNEELGQVQYVFSDKTGTLTENLMEFRLFSVAGRSCRHFSLPEFPGSISSDALLAELVQARAAGLRLSPELQQTFDFLESVALCQGAVPDHPDDSPPANPGGLSTVLRQSASDSSIVYQASSADEVALLSAARDLFFTFKRRTPDTVTLNVLNAREDVSYTILDTIDFTSDRKRMSVIYRYPNGRIVLLCKGADSVILSRLQPADLVSREQAAINRRTLADTGTFASKGLRTLLYAYRILDEREYADWASRYADASAAIQNRAARVAAVAEEIEQGLMLLGATAIEDRLQGGVPETIEKLRRAGVRVWMLTGDKTETAVNISNTCKLIRPDSEVLIVKEDGKGGGKEEEVAAIGRSVEDAVERFRKVKGIGSGGGGARSPDDAYSKHAGGERTHVVAVIEGHTLTRLQAPDGADDSSQNSEKSGHNARREAVLERFLDLAVVADSVVCCRFSPAQKALMVSKVRRRLAEQYRCPTGASPLKVELEGRPSAAARFWAAVTLKPRESGVTLAIGDGANDIPMIESAHVGIGITGREGLAASRSADYAIAKFRFLQNVAFYGTQFVFQYWTGGTGTSLYEKWTLAINNVLFTSIPVVIIGIYEKDLNRSTLMAVPELYRYGQLNQGFNFRVFFRWMFQGALHAILAVAIPACFFGGFWQPGSVDYIAPSGLAGLPQLFSPGISGSTWVREMFMSDGSGAHQETSLYAFGTISYTISIIFCTVKVLYIESHNWTAWHHGVTIVTFALWVVYNVVYSELYPHFGQDFGYEYKGLFWVIGHTQFQFWAIVILASLIGIFFIDHWVKSMGWLGRLLRWGRRGGREMDGNGSAVGMVDAERVSRIAEVERVRADDMATTHSGRAVKYQMAREDAAIAAASAIGEHQWEKEVEWWQCWERAHKVTADLGEED
ncbi:hypothetical protein HK101_011428 [Irineochytrium annulatum]|nr:hypothetical protein HK101_011428 [Irineochytrium annulatum]